MHIRTLAFATVASGLAMASAAYAGPLGGAIGGGLGGGVSGPVGGIGGGLGGGAGIHGAGGGGGGGGSIGGSIGPALGGASRIGGGAPGLGGSVGGGGSAGGSIGPALGGNHRIAGGFGGSDPGSASASTSGGLLGPGLSASAGGDSQGSAHGATNGVINANPRSALNRTLSATDTSVGRVRGDADATTAVAEDTAERARQNVTHRADATRSSATGLANRNLVRAHNTASLAALTAGQTVRTVSGTTLGTIAQVQRSHDGDVRAVLVRTAKGGRRVLRLAPRTLSVSGGVVTTSQTHLTAHG